MGNSCHCCIEYAADTRCSMHPRSEDSEITSSIGVNSGGWGVATPSFGLGGSWDVAGGRRGSWTGLGKHYSVFCTESKLENVFFMRKREVFCKNVGVEGEYLRRKVNFLNFLSWD